MLRILHHGLIIRRVLLKLLLGSWSRRAWLLLLKLEIVLPLCRECFQLDVHADCIWDFAVSWKNQLKISTSTYFFAGALKVIHTCIFFSILWSTAKSIKMSVIYIEIEGKWNSLEFKYQRCKWRRKHVISVYHVVSLAWFHGRQLLYFVHLERRLFVNGTVINIASPCHLRFIHPFVGSSTPDPMLSVILMS